MGSLRRAGLDDTRELLLVFACESKHSSFGGGCFEVIEIARVLLIGTECIAHHIEDFEGECFTRRSRDVLLSVEKILDCFVHTIDPDRREVIAEGAKILVGVRIES